VTAPVLAEVVAALRAVTGEDALWAATIGPATRLDGDLLLDSIELAALSWLLRERHGDRVDLAGYVAGLDIDRIIALTVGDVAGYVAAGGRPR
jgi:acyl carrier protein